MVVEDLIIIESLVLITRMNFHLVSKEKIYYQEIIIPSHIYYKAFNNRAFYD